MKLPILLTIFSFFLGCSNNTVYKELEAIDSLMERDLLDSARVALSGMDVSAVEDDGVIAYYDMLSYLIEFRQGNVPASDSLIDHSIDYYTKKNDHDMLARSYYYKGRILHKRDKVKEAIICLKKAESHSEDISNYLLRSRIKNSLAEFNISGGEHQKGLAYSLKAVEYAEISGNKEQMLLSMDKLAVIYNRIGKRDSGSYYREKCMHIIKDVPPKSQVAFLANIALTYKDIGTEKAKQYVFQSLQIEERPGPYRILADIYLAEGNTAEAEKSLRRGIAICKNDMFTEINLLNDLREYKQSIGQTAEAAQIGDKIIFLSDSLQRKLQNDSIVEAQMIFENQKASESFRHQKYNLRIVYIISFLTLLLLCGGAIYHNVRKRRKARIIIDSQHEKLKEYEKTTADYVHKVEKLSEKEKESKRMAENLRRNMKNLEDRHQRDIEAAKQKAAERMIRGYRLFEAVKGGACISKWTKEERKLFVEYYTTVNPSLTDAKKFSQNEIFYNILTDMGNDDEAVMRIMSLSLSAFRTMKSRLKKK